MPRLSGAFSVSSFSTIMCVNPPAPMPPSQPSLNSTPLNAMAEPFYGPKPSPLPEKLIYFPHKLYNQQPLLLPQAPPRWFSYHQRCAHEIGQIWIYPQVYYYNTSYQPQPAKAPLQASLSGDGKDLETEKVDAEVSDISASDGKELGRCVTKKKASVRGRRSRNSGGEKLWVRKARMREVELRGTTLMIRNIPNQFMRHDLLNILDQHCQEENRMAELRSDPCRSAYDFVYLPMDFKKDTNLGYAFVNFTSNVAAKRYQKAFNNHEWSVRVCKKICEICSARIQGKNALMRHFERTNYPYHSEEFLPVVLSPPRDGLNCTEPTNVGRLSKNCLSSQPTSVCQ